MFIKQIKSYIIFECFDIKFPIKLCKHIFQCQILQKYERLVNLCTSVKSVKVWCQDFIVEVEHAGDKIPIAGFLCKDAGSLTH